MIRMEGVVKDFDGFKALDEMNINVKRGSIYGLVGVNGSGKTTIIKHLTGAYIPDAGEVSIDGQPVFDNVEIKSRMAYISDDLSFYGMYTLKKYAAYYRKLYPNWNEQRYREMVREFNMDVDCRLVRFSKGMQKQAAFVLAMSSMPNVLILDEPIDGLDPVVRRKVISFIIDDVAEREMTVLVSSHNLKEMEGLCDSIGIIGKGRMIIEKDLDELKSDIHKVQVVYPEGVKAPVEGLNVLHREKRGSVELYIIRGEREKVESVLTADKPLVFDMLPLTLEEIFIYEAGGDHSEIKDVLI